jgi:hypothetical protein
VKARGAEERWPSLLVGGESAQGQHREWLPNAAQGDRRRHVEHHDVAGVMGEHALEVPLRDFGVYFDSGIAEKSVNTSPLPLSQMGLGFPRCRFARCRRLTLGRRRDDHPRDAELVGDRAEALGEEGSAERHLHLPALGERVEPAVAVGRVVRGERQREALGAAFSGGSGMPRADDGKPCATFPRPFRR